MGEERFTKSVVELIAKRAANVCSNPDCAAITSGPAAADDSSINLGEAAHIYGARPGSARYREQMSDAERAESTNAIWLCRNCHKIVDADTDGFSAELLFEWRRAHENSIRESVGKAGALLREKVNARLMRGLDRCSYLAQQIILDKPRYWEYRLVAELLRDWLEPVKFRWDALSRGLYYRPMRRLKALECAVWHGQQLVELSAQVTALAALVSKELERAWGPPGEPGSVLDIYRVSPLIVEGCQRVLEWEERVRFTSVPDQWTEAKEMLVGIAGSQIQKVFEIPGWLSSIFSNSDPTGKFTYEITFSFSEEWLSGFRAAAMKASGGINIG